MFEIEYIMNKNGQPEAVVIPIEVWNEILPKEDCSLDELSEAFEYYCLNKANEALKYSDKPDFVEFLLSCPKTDINFEIKRSGLLNITRSYAGSWERGAL
jgi:hypothetical protein